MNKPDVIIYSHGFGVRKDDKGLFTDIAAALPGIRHEMVEFNKIDEEAGTLFVPPLQQQAGVLSEAVRRLRNDYSGATIDLIAHSQGCVVAALAELTGIRNVILLAPPSELDADRRVKKYGSRPGAQMDLSGVSRVPNSDGTAKLIPAEFWQGLRELEPIELYVQLSRHINVVLVEAANDEVALPLPASVKAALAVQSLGANHDFSGTARSGLIDLIKKEIGA